MNRAWAIWGAAALLIHAAVLFGFRLRQTPASLIVGDSAVEVSLVAFASLVALPVIAASEAVVSGPVASGKNFFPTTPQAATMNRLKTGDLSAAQAERSGRPSRKGRPIASVPAP